MIYLKVLGKEDNEKEMRERGREREKESERESKEIGRASCRERV